MKYLLSFILPALMSLAFVFSCTAQTSDAAPACSSEDGTRITLTIGDKMVPAILFNTKPAKDLMARLPVTVSLNRGPVDYCGDIAPIDYGKDDVQAGYHSGDLAYWIPSQDFVIFTENKNSSSGAPDLFIIGRVCSDIKEIQDLGSTIRVTIALDR
jgi:hypothetical protein